jgi:hypothetical protein
LLALKIPCFIAADAQHARRLEEVEEKYRETVARAAIKLESTTN